MCICVHFYALFDWIGWYFTLQGHLIRMFDLDSWLFPSVIFIVFCSNLNFSQFYQKTGGVSREIPQDSSRSNLPSYFLVPISKMPFVFESSFLFPRSYLGNAFCSQIRFESYRLFCLAPIGDREASRLFLFGLEHSRTFWTRDLDFSMAGIFLPAHSAILNFSEQDVRSFFLR